MPRKIEKNAVGEIRRYVPESYGNRTALLDERIAVHIRVPTQRDGRHLREYGEAFDVIKDAEGNVTVKSTSEGQTKRLDRAVENHVVKVENYIAANGAPITNGVEFAEHAEPDFFYEVAHLILENAVIGEDTEKKLEESHGSLSRATRALNGTVISVEKADSIGQEIAEETIKGLPILQGKESGSTVVQNDG